VKIVCVNWRIKIWRPAHYVCVNLRFTRTESWSFNIHVHFSLYVPAFWGVFTQQRVLSSCIHAGLGVLWCVWLGKAFWRVGWVMMVISVWRYPWEIDETDPMYYNCQRALVALCMLAIYLKVPSFPLVSDSWRWVQKLSTPTHSLFHQTQRKIGLCEMLRPFDVRIGCAYEVHMSGRYVKAMSYTMSIGHV